MNYRDLSRRSFLRTVSSAAAAGAVWPAPLLIADPHRALAEILANRPRRFSWDPPALAACALQAALSAGATYADVRVDRQLFQSLEVNKEVVGDFVHSEGVRIGIRVIAGGQWGFVGTDVLTMDSVADAARRAVAQARVNAQARKTTIELAPVPVVHNGQWSTSETVDPFTVPLGEMQEALLQGTRAVLATPGVVNAEAEVEWQRLERTFASSEGSQITQRITRGFHDAHVVAKVGDTVAGANVTALRWGPGGYESIRDVDLAASMREAAEVARRQATTGSGTPPHGIDVGRYELVASASAMGQLVGQTILPALSMNRALGKDLEGTSYAIPPEQVLDQRPIAAAGLTIHLDRTMPNGLMTVGWDDEGVAAQRFTLVQNGIPVDYVALRETATQLTRWRRPGHALTLPHGCAVAGGGTPQEGQLDYAIDPASSDVTLDDLIKDVKRGVYVDAVGLSVDSGLMTGESTAMKAQEIRNGKLVGALKGMAMQFQTAQLWHGLDALGGRTTQVTREVGFNAVFHCRTMQSVPAHFKEVNIVNASQNAVAGAPSLPF